MKRLKDRQVAKLLGLSLKQFRQIEKKKRQKVGHRRRKAVGALA